MKFLPHGLRTLSWLAVATVITIAIIVKFVKLEDAPRGFFIDENDVAINIVCLGESGHDMDGRPAPLFVNVGGGGAASPTHLYLLTAWTKLFGISIGAQRAFAAFVTCLAIFGLFFLGRLLMGPKAAIFTVLAGLLSPWAFLFGRQAMDDPCLFPMGLVWGIYFFLRSEKVRDAFLAALFFSIAFYSYSPSRVQIPLLGLPLFLLKKEKMNVRASYLATFIITGIILCSPIIYGYLYGDLMTRFNVVGIFSPWYSHQLGSDTFYGAVKVFAQNMVTHFRPSYLFISGDRNLRHSTQFTGELGWLDDLALLSGVLLLLRQKFFLREGLVDKTFLFFVAGFIFGIVPAALTWESLPHALRSVGCWPFVALMVGFIFSKAEHFSKLFIVPVSVVSICFGIFYLQWFFNIYPNISEPWFDVSVKRAAIEAQSTHRWKEFLQQFKDYGTGPRSKRFYLVLYGGETCDSSRDIVNSFYKTQSP